MPKTYSVAEARAKLPEILDDVEAGNDVQLTRRGRAVARLLSTQRYDSLQAGHAGFIDAYRAFVGRHDAAERGVDSDVLNAVRDRSPGRRVRL